MATRTMEKSRMTADRFLPAKVEDEEAPPEEAQELSEDAQAMEDFLIERGALGLDAFIHIYRIREDGEEAFLFKRAPIDFQMEEIGKLYGSGKYRLRGYHYSASKGRRVLFHNQAVMIETPGGKAIQPAATPVQLDPLQTLASIMSQGFVKLGELIVAARPQPESEMAMLEKLKMYKDLFSNPMPQVIPQAGVGGLTESFGLMKEIMGFVKENAAVGEGGEVGNGQILMKAIETLGEPLVKLLSSKMENPGLNVPAVLPSPAPSLAAAPSRVDPPAATVHAPASPHEESPMILQLRSHLNILIQAAAVNADPAPYSDAILDQIEEAKILELLNDPQWFNKLSLFDKRVIGFKPWFEELRTLMLEVLTEPSLTEQGRESQTGGQPLSESPPDVPEASHGNDSNRGSKT